MIRNATLVLLSTGALAQATIIEFDLSPGGTGMSSANEVPAVSGSGTGNVISEGISFDTNTSTLSFVMGYGSAAGFTDLSGAATSMHIHGPAAAGANAPVLFNLTSAGFPAAIPAKGGIIYGSLVYPADKVAALLAGRNYVNIHTAAFPGGEIRGQLIPLLPPTVVCPASSTVECGVLTTYTAIVSDANGDAMQVVWALNGVPVQTDQVAAGGPPSAAPVEFTAQLPLGINTLAVTATDSTGIVGTCSSSITVVDTTPPVIVSASVNPKSLWPPNHKMVPVRVSAVVTDECGPATWEILSITSNESGKALGSGNTANDWKITGPETALVRAERSGKNKAGRIYTITLQATDGAGNKSAPATVIVTVAHDQGKNKGASQDDGQDDGGNPGKGKGNGKGKDKGNDVSYGKGKGKKF